MADMQEKLMTRKLFTELHAEFRDTLLSPHFTAEGMGFQDVRRGDKTE